jgi:hypothetical protein
MDRALGVGRVDHDGEMHDSVDSQLPDELSNRGVPCVGVDEVHLLQRADRIGNVTSEEVRHVRSKPARDLSAEWIRNAGDQNT